MKYLVSFLESNSTIPLEVGDILYHSTSYDFEKPKVGRDKVFWTCKNKIISKIYIFEWNNLNALGSNEFLKKYGLGGRMIKNKKDPMSIKIVFGKKHPFYKKTECQKMKILDDVMKKNKIESKK